MSTVANAVPAEIAAILNAFDAGDTTRATELQLRATPLIEAMMGAGLPGTVTAKTLLTRLGRPGARAPLLPADRETADRLLAHYKALTAAL